MKFILILLLVAGCKNSPEIKTKAEPLYKEYLLGCHHAIRKAIVDNGHDPDEKYIEIQRYCLELYLGWQFEKPNQ
jgi:hypothetical protein